MEVEVDPLARFRGSEGFAVETASGRLGTVEAFCSRGASGMDNVLVVRAGRLGRRRMIIGVDDIAAVRRSERVVQLRSRWMAMQV